MTTEGRWRIGLVVLVVGSSIGSVGCSGAARSTSSEPTSASPAVSTSAPSAVQDQATGPAEPTADSSPSSATGLSDHEAENLAVVLTPSDQNGYVSADEALTVARREYPFVGQTPRVDAFLYRVTDTQTRATDGSAIVDQPMWIVRFSGIEEPTGGPIRDDGSPSEGRILRFAYVFIDARTGEWLYTTWKE